MKYHLFAIATILLVASLFIPELDEENSDKPSYILFDGECCMCNSFIKFLVDRDPNHALFKFTSLQSDKGKELLKENQLPDDLSTVVLIDGNGKVSLRSTAILKSVAKLGKPWSFSNIFLAIPAPIRDWIYSTVTPYRYAMFGKVDQCEALASNVQHGIES